MLKAEFSENALPNDLTKPTKAPSVSSVSASRKPIPRIERVSDEVAAGATLGIDTLISWQSPLLGQCYGRIAIICDEYEWMLVEDHSVTKDFAFVSKTWDVTLDKDRQVDYGDETR